MKVRVDQFDDHWTWVNFSKKKKMRRHFPMQPLEYGYSWFNKHFLAEYFNNCDTMVRQMKCIPYDQSNGYITCESRKQLFEYSHLYSWLLDTIKMSSWSIKMFDSLSCFLIFASNTEIPAHKIALNRSIKSSQGSGPSLENTKRIQTDLLSLYLASGVCDRILTFPKGPGPICPLPLICPKNLLKWMCNHSNF